MSDETPSSEIPESTTPAHHPNQAELLEAFARLAEDPADELAVALLIAAVIDEQLDPRRVEQQMQALLGDAEAQGISDTEGVLALLRGRGFGQKPLTAVDLTHSSIDWLLQQRQGLPIVMAVVIITLARQLGMRAHGINFPGHFLLRVDDNLIDPLALAILPAESLPVPAGGSLQQMLAKAGPLSIGFRMLNNLKGYYLQLQNWPAALAATNYQLAMMQHTDDISALVHFERGEYRQRMGQAEAALEEYSKCVQLTPEPILRDKAESRIEGVMSELKGILH